MIKTQYVTAVAISIGVLFAQGCSHSATEKRLDSKVASETEINTRADLNDQTDTRIETAPGLSDDQRTQLSALSESMRSQTNELNKESLRLKSLLVQAVIAPKYVESDVNAIKKRIRKLEDKKVTALFNAVDQANEVLGRDTDNSAVMSQFVKESRTS